MPDFINTELKSSWDNLKTKQGIDKLSVMLKVANIIESNESLKVEREINRFKSFLVQQLKRGITKREEISFMEGIVKYLQSEAASNERMQAMNYLFELEFLEVN